jgi:hypothetical protein
LALRLAEFGYPEEALAAAREIGDARWRAEALAELASRLAEEEREGVLRETLAVAQEIRDVQQRTEVLVGLALYLPEGLLEEVLTAAQVAESELGLALVRLAPRLAQLPRERLFHLWTDALPGLSSNTRKDLLVYLRYMEPLISALGGVEALAETLRAIQDVGHWWP